VAFLSFSFSKTTSFTDADYWTYDFLANHGRRPLPSKRIVFVDFDDLTFERIQRFPIPRHVVSEVLARISEGNPKVIGLDFFLSEQRAEAEDRELQEALTKAGNVVVASQLSRGGLPVASPLQLFCGADGAGQGSGFCREGSPGAFGYAFVNMPVDSDGFIRQSFLFSAARPPAISFPLMLAQLFVDSDEQIHPGNSSHAVFLKHAIPYADNSRTTFLIGEWDDHLVNKIKAIDVLEGRVVPATEFSNKLVLIGQSNDAARDREFTPLFRHAHPDGTRTLLAGTEIHAAAIATLLNGTAVGTIGAPILWLATLVFCGALMWFTMVAPLRYTAFVVPATMFCVYGGAQLLWNYGHIWYKFLLTDFSIALVPPVALAYNFVQERLRKSEALADRQQLMGLFSRYVSPEVAVEIWRRRDQVILSGEERVATVLFSDIRGFTAATAGKPSPRVLEWLNGYLTAMDEVISAESGFLNKFIGDGLMVLFGVPLSNGPEEDARRAVQAGLGMLGRVKELNRANYGNGLFPPLRIGIGIHTGKLTSGNVGSRNRLEYSVIGETVNLASRLESLNKEHHTDILMTETTYALVRESFPGFREVCAAQVRGFTEHVRLFTIDSSAIAPGNRTQPHSEAHR
jgi:adenylate cyclase